MFHPLQSEQTYHTAVFSVGLVIAEFKACATYIATPVAMLCLNIWVSKDNFYLYFKEAS